MARKCKCKLCKKQLDTNIAYKIINNKKNEYYCSKEEYENYLYEKNKRIELLSYIKEDIFGYKDKELISTLLLKKIKELHDLNYTYEEILDCFKFMKDKIIYQFNHNKGLSTEGKKISYMIAMIKNTINDTFKIKNESSINDKVNIDIDILELMETRKIKRKKSKNLLDYINKY